LLPERWFAAAATYRLWSPVGPPGHVSLTQVAPR